jgi:hypothetical protein
VRGDRIARDEYALALKPHRRASRGVAWHGEQRRAALPVERVAISNQTVGVDGSRWGETLFERHARHDLFKQRHLPVGQLWRRRGLLGPDERRVTDRRDDARAGSGHDRGGRSGVVAVPVREEDLHDPDLPLSGPREAAEQLEDGLVVAGRARVDQAAPVTLTDGVSVDEIGA